MTLTQDHFNTFLLCSYALGWGLVGRRAKKERLVDLCQFIRAFVFAPFLLTLLIMGATGLGLFIWKIFIPNILQFLEAIGIIGGSCAILFALGYFAVAPAVKKAFGVAKPFSSKICVVLYRAKR